MKNTAEKNKCIEVFRELERIRTEYLERTKEQPQEGYPNELLTMVWDQFKLIHQIIQNVEDISEGVVDVVANSEAKYLEIRTTPKKMSDGSRDEYINGFETGLLNANKAMPDKKVVGLLSLDRTLHNLDDARHFIKRIKNSPNKLLVGLDISGNPEGARTLTGDTLSELVLLALNSNVPIAIHMGESKSDVEKKDTDSVLDALEQWKSLQDSQENNLFYGKVRLGHCINLTQLQQQRIANLHLPVEVCPTCHSKLNWHLESLPHPATKIYPDISDEVVGGTDDKYIFDGAMKSELKTTIGFFSNTKGLTNQQIKEHQSHFSFSSSVM